MYRFTITVCCIGYRIIVQYGVPLSSSKAQINIEEYVLSLLLYPKCNTATEVVEKRKIKEASVKTTCWNHQPPFFVYYTHHVYIA